MFEKISKELTQEGYDHSLAIATNAEVEAGAACGQLSLVLESQEGK